MSTGQYLATERDAQTNTGNVNNITDIMEVQRWIKVHGADYPAGPSYQMPDLDGAVEIAKQQAGQLANRASSGFTTQNPFNEITPRLFTASERQGLLIMSLGGGLLALLVFSFFSGKPLVE